jgi:GR25 family glycosyltransferase involved in LPS biosynthesis
MPVFLENVYVINLERAQDRLKAIDTNLKSYGIPYRRIPAVDGKDMSQAELEKVTTWASRTILCTPSIIGCALSHMHTWDIVSRSQDKWHLVLEDDVAITDETIKYLHALSKIEKNIPKDSIINLSCPHVFCKNPFQVPSRTSAFNGLLEIPLVSTCTAAYLITPLAAANLLKRVKRVSYHIDAVMNFYARPNLYIPPKCIVKHVGLNPTKSFNMGISNFMPLLDAFLEKTGLTELRFYMNTTYLALFLRIPITMYHILFVVLMVINVKYLKLKLFNAYLLLELIIYILLQINKIAI